MLRFVCVAMMMITIMGCGREDGRPAGKPEPAESGPPSIKAPGGEIKIDGHQQLNVTLDEMSSPTAKRLFSGGFDWER